MTPQANLFHIECNPIIHSLSIDDDILSTLVLLRCQCLIRGNNFWNPDIKGWQIFILASRFVGITLLFALCCIFLYRTNKGLGEGEIFPKSNIPIIRWTALVAALLAFVHCNYDAVVKGESEMMLDSNTILIPLIVLLFAGLYKMAYLAAKDSKLAI